MVGKSTIFKKFVIQPGVLFSVESAIVADSHEEAMALYPLFAAGGAFGNFPAIFPEVQEKLVAIPDGCELNRIPGNHHKYELIKNEHEYSRRLIV